ncbi:uncharacterized protein LOC133715120 [Rosa rugosa]|uniref:uncharacterized protein LOC133715120 n=1 Tax=Rosa rugosa TaxID=74645 RepID=UPI002B41838B|nr:uncharacterized protein LOC133715120 [Rosa rugosa]
MLHLGKENSGSGGPIFPNLEVLEVTHHSLGLKNLESSAISFRNLTTLKVVYCPGLEHLITYSVAKSLKQLTTMEVNYCPRIAVIVATDGDDAAEEITFSRLQVLTLQRLPNLQGFCSRSCIVNLPSLTTLSMSNRLKLKIFQEKLKITSKHSDTEEDEEIGVPSAETNIAS